MKSPKRMPSRVLSTSRCPDMDCIISCMTRVDLARFPSDANNGCGFGANGMGANRGPRTGMCLARSQCL